MLAFVLDNIIVPHLTKAFGVSSEFSAVLIYRIQLTRAMLCSRF